MRSWLVLTLACIPLRASADDPKDKADTVASTWTGGALRLADDDKRFLLAASTLYTRVRVRGEVSAPLDEKTRTAAFLDEDGLAPAFKATGYVGYDSTYGALDDNVQAEHDAMKSYCAANNLADKCSSDVIEVHRARNGAPRSLRETYWGVGVELAYAYDRAKAYVADVAQDPVAFASSDLQVGVQGSLYPEGWALIARGGVAQVNRVEFTAFERCTELPTSSMTISGSACKDEKLLKKDYKAETTGYARLSAAYYPTSGLLGLLLGAAELRTNLENLGSDRASFDAHLLVFAKAIELQPTSLRTGIGVTVRTALDAPEDAKHEAGDVYDYSLFGVIGTSF